MLLVDQKLRAFQGAYDKDKGERVHYKLSYSFSERLDTIESLDIEFDFPFTDCAVPVLNLVKEKMGDREFVIAPGP